MKTVNMILRAKPFLYQNSSYTSVLHTGFTSLTLPEEAYNSFLIDFSDMDFSADGFLKMGYDDPSIK